MPPNAAPNAAHNAAHDAYFADLDRRLRRAVDSGRNAYIYNRRAGPFDEAEFQYSALPRRLVLKGARTSEAERRKGHLSRLAALLEAIAREKHLSSARVGNRRVWQLSGW